MYRPVWPGKRSRIRRIASISSLEDSATIVAERPAQPVDVDAESRSLEYIHRIAVDRVIAGTCREPCTDHQIVVLQVLRKLNEQRERFF
jgi:hypothetical protein